MAYYGRPGLKTRYTPTDGEKKREVIGVWAKKILWLSLIIAAFGVLWFTFKHYKVETGSLEIIIGLPAAAVLVWMFKGH